MAESRPGDHACVTGLPRTSGYLARGLATTFSEELGDGGGAHRRAGKAGRLAEEGPGQGQAHSRAVRAGRLAEEHGNGVRSLHPRCLSLSDEVSHPVPLPTYLELHPLPCSFLSRFSVARMFHTLFISRPVSSCLLCLLSLATPLTFLFEILFRCGEEGCRRSKARLLLLKLATSD